MVKQAICCRFILMIVEYLVNDTYMILLYLSVFFFSIFNVSDYRQLGPNCENDEQSTVFPPQ